MTFSKEQIEALKAPLNKGHVKQRAQAGRQLSYIEGWHAIDEANRIFGFDAWDRETVELKELGEARQVDGKWRVAYMARVRVTVRSEKQHPTPSGMNMLSTNRIVRDGTGYGSGIDKDLGQAHESAIKEAETDAMKRALMTFGNPFGLALYDKEQRNVVDEPSPVEVQKDEPTLPPLNAHSGDFKQHEPEDESKKRYIEQCKNKIAQPSATEAELRNWWNNQGESRRSFGLTQEDVDQLKKLLTVRLEKFKRAA